MANTLAPMGMRKDQPPMIPANTEVFNKWFIANDGMKRSPYIGSPEATYKNTGVLPGQHSGAHCYTFSNGKGYVISP